MDIIAAQSNKERRELFSETATRRGTSFQLIEKDFWVCWTLRKLFELPGLGPVLMFKGGTSLSKIYRIIERFSEDIDITINRGYLGFGGESDPINLQGNKKRRQVEALREGCSEKVQTELFELLFKSISIILEDPSEDEWQLEIDEQDRDGQTLLFSFPRDKESQATSTIEYIRPVIRIELGARGDQFPSENHAITSYAAEEFPSLFSEASYVIKVLSAERTFWEKATILHDEYNRSSERDTAERISRHYYDLYKLAQTPIGKRAKEDYELLQSVVENKKTFFPRAGAKYDEALLGKLHLIPHPDRIAALKNDYEKMREMFFVEPPRFEDILKELEILENEINSNFEG